jgi:hypothetical protein
VAYLITAVLAVMVMATLAFMPPSPDSLIDEMARQAASGDTARLAKTVNRLAALGAQAIPVAAERLRTSMGTEQGALLTYFKKLGASARPFLETEYERCSSGFQRLSVLRGMAAATGDVNVIPKYHAVLVSPGSGSWAVSAAQTLLGGIENAQGQYFDRVAELSSLDATTRKKLDSLFREWWSGNMNRIQWTGIRFRVQR